MNLTWNFDVPGEEWDRNLAAHGGHPLQSALWGDARRAIDGIEDRRWAAYIEGRLTLMARFESRSIPGVGRVAWLPRGPVSTAVGADAAEIELRRRLRSAGFILCVDDRYAQANDRRRLGVPLLPRPRTAWVDLTPGRETVWKSIDPQWRYGVRSAGRLGVIVEQSHSPDDATTFFRLCEAISGKKGFDLSGSAELLNALLVSSAGRAVETRLFVARFNGAVAGGAAVLRCGKTLHYFWGAVDRAFSKQRPGEAVHGAILDWALAHDVERYDLEGIDQVANPGTYQFKMKMGATEVDLVGRTAYPLNLRGRLALAVGQRFGRI